MKALISVYDKTGVVEFAAGLRDLGVELFSTGGTLKALQESSVPVKSVTDLTGFPEILDGRVKTLHPRIHGGILARRDLPGHMSQLTSHEIEPIDLVCVNLYPFVETVSRPEVTLDEALENIDIGGPTLLRAAAKNFPSVTVVVDPADYPWVVERLRGQDLSLKERLRLAGKAFQHVALYDSAVARYLSHGEEELPQELTLGFRKVMDTRYGENPHQKGALYTRILEVGGVAAAQQLWGKELSFNNILDADAAWQTVRDFPDPTVAVIKHTNPCGLASDHDSVEAYRRAYAGDPVSAFGGIVAFNVPVTPEVAQEMREVFYEVVVAPGFHPKALETFKRKKNLRLLQVQPAGKVPGLDLDWRRIDGGALVQTVDSLLEDDPQGWRTVTVTSPTPEQREDLLFAWRAAKHIKSNAIVLARDKALVGMGAGQPNRVTSVHLALRAGGERSRGTVLASDAFFPFPDGVEMAAQGGIQAIVQPGGSVRDQEVIQVADQYNIAMVFTGKRHFRH